MHTDPSAYNGILQLVEKYFQPLIYNPNSGSSPSAQQAPGGICGVYYAGYEYYFPYGTIVDLSEQPLAPNENTVFGIGSVTKTFTTSMLGQQADLLPAFVRDYLPPGYSLSPIEQEELTFQMLATFTGGIFPSDPPHHRQSQEDFIAFINSINPSGLPAPNQYSNSSIGFLGQILLSMAGYTDLDDGSITTQWWEQNLFSRLSMKNSGYPAKTDSEHPLSAAFAFDGSGYTTTSYSPWVPWGTAGRAFSTCSDMMNFAQAYCGISTIDGNKVPETILNGMLVAQTPPTVSSNTPAMLSGQNQQALAWVVHNIDGLPAYCAKDGGLPGVSSYITFCREAQIAVVMLTNMSGVHPSAAANPIIERLIIQSQKGNNT